MSISTLFTIAIAAILLRIFWLKIKDANMKGEGFKRLPPKDQLAVLKECLLNNPTNGNLQNLKNFCEKTGADLDTESYRPFMQKQLELTRKKDALAEDNELFGAEATWMDQIRPLEFEEAESARKEGRHEDFILRTYAEKLITEKTKYDIEKLKCHRLQDGIELDRRTPRYVIGQPMHPITKEVNYRQKHKKSHR